MKFTPILFSIPMVEAILTGRKTQTRRVVKTSINECNHQLYVEADWKNEPTQMVEGENGWYCRLCGNGVDWSGNAIKSPYGKVGDILWVKETHYKFGEWKKNGTTKTGRQKWKFVAVKSAGVKFEDKPPIHLESPKFRGLGWHKRPSLFMERADARLFLEITEIRMERLSNISDADAIAEGILCVSQQGLVKGKMADVKRYKNYGTIGNIYLPPYDSFKSLWRSINGLESWKQNPWVWVISFKPQLK